MFLIDWPSALDKVIERASEEETEETSAPVADSALNARSTRREVGAGLELVGFIPGKDGFHEWSSECSFSVALLCRK